MLGYGNGEMAPGLTSPSAAEIYMAGHNILISHARAVDTYRKNFQPAQNGKIGITLNCNWTEPAPSDDPEKAKKNAEAAERSVVWNLGWFADPVYTGDYVSPQRCCTPLWYEAPTQYCCLVAPVSSAKTRQILKFPQPRTLPNLGGARLSARDDEAALRTPAPRVHCRRKGAAQGQHRLLWSKLL